MDGWFAAKDNVAPILSKHKCFGAVLKDNRLVVVSQADQGQARFARVDSLRYPPSPERLCDSLPLYLLAGLE